MTSGKMFEGVKILDFTHYLAGPFCTLQLALQGADVIKIEPLGGEASRQASTAEPVWSDRRMTPSWVAVNANKRSLALDLAKPQAVDIIHKLVLEADVVCENFRPGVMDKLGIGWAQLREINPRLIYCAISGFGTTGPERRTPSFDGKIQAMSGLMSITGEPESGPMRAGFPLGDISTGITAAFALAGALFQRTHTGKGQLVDVAMLDSMLNFLCYPVSEYLVTGHVQPQSGNLSITRKPTAARFRCKSGYIVLAALTDAQWERLMKTVGCEQLLADPRLADWPSRIAHGDEVHRVVEAALCDEDAETWETRLLAADVPCGRVRDIAEVVALPQLAHRGTVQQAQTPWGPVRLAGSGFQLEHGNGGVDQPIARPGEHSRAILTSLGYDDAAFDALCSAGITEASD